MIVEIVRFIFLFIFIMSFLFIGQELFLFLRAIFSKNDEFVDKYQISKARLIWLGCAISFIITYLVV